MISPLPELGNGLTLADRVTESLHRAILEGHFAFGERLDPQRIAQELEVSATPVREAIRRLEATGLIINQPHRGAFVLELTPRDIQEIYMIRRLLEAEVARNVTTRITQEQLDELDALLTANEARVANGDFSTHYEVDVRLHGTLIGLSDSRLMRALLDSLNDRIALVRRFAQSHRGPHVSASIVDHRAILEALKDRDTDLVVRRVEAHLENSATRIGELAEPVTS